jgi:hypothetical protein
MVVSSAWKVPNQFHNVALVCRLKLTNRVDYAYNAEIIIMNHYTGVKVFPFGNPGSAGLKPTLAS